MKTYSRLFALVVLLVLPFVGETQTVSFEAKEFLQYTAVQKTPVWCWAAVTQSILNYHKVNITQEEIVDSVKHRVVPETANMYEMWTVLNGWKTTSGGNTYAIDGSFTFPGPPPTSVLLRTLEIGRPAILGIRHQHVVVAYKASFSRTGPGDANTSLLSITYFDPWDGSSKTIKPETSEFKDISDTWIVWARPAGSGNF